MTLSNIFISINLNDRNIFVKEHFANLISVKKCCRRTDMIQDQISSRKSLIIKHGLTGQKEVTNTNSNKTGH